MEQTTVMPGAEPFGFDGDETGILLVHGYTGTPQGLREWGEHLSKAGHTVLCPRLPGHGTTAADLHGVGWRDWTAEAEMSMRGLFERCSSVFVAGLSMGGAIVLDLAARLGKDLAGVIAVNPFLYSVDPRRFLVPVLGKVPMLLKGVYNDVADPSQRELGYPKISTKASASVLEYGRLVMQRLPQIDIPALIFSSRQDHVVHPGNAQMVIDRIASTDKRLVTLDRSYHVATLDYDRYQIFEESAAWIGSHIEE